MNSIKTISFMILLINFYGPRIICAETDKQSPTHSRYSSGSVTFHTATPSPTSQEPNIRISHRPFGPQHSNTGSNVSAQDERYLNSPRTSLTTLDALTALCIGSPTRIRVTEPSADHTSNAQKKTDVDEFGTLSDIAWVTESSPTTKVPPNSRTSPATHFSSEGPEFSNVSPTDSPRFQRMQTRLSPTGFPDVCPLSMHTQQESPKLPAQTPQFPPQ